MSQYFHIGDEVVWSPATGVAQLYVRRSDAMSPVVDRPTGIGPVIADEYTIDLQAFETFIDALLRYYEQSNHTILKSLMDGFLATSLVMLERGGGMVPALGDARLIELRDAHRAMPS